MYIGIVCPNFSGSTVVGSVLHRFSSVQHVGEIWKIFSEKQVAQAFCKECGPEPCPYFSESFKSRLRESETETVPSLLKTEFNADFIISGDKKPDHYEKFSGVPDRVLVLVKNKFAAALSYAKRNPDFSNSEAGSDRIKIFEDACDQYYEDFFARLNWVKSKYSDNNIIYASPEVLVSLNDNQLSDFGVKLFGKMLQLSSSPFDEKFHYIGGNHKVSKGKDLGYFKGEFRADRRYEDIMDGEAYCAIDRVVLKKFKKYGFEVSDRRYLESWVSEFLN